ncbi:hypothetical protein ACTG2W_02380 [Aeromonas sp. 96A]|uniref:DUF3892 domain-containing protein n=1 Tax=Aeromonas TaxID=642 RepID=UPI000D10A29F|nr:MULTISPECIES: DUF3892 domain-containing protein [Aeromonas]MCR3972683.1 DUF3892 domain-containing protein [Aeromonas veronii]MCR3977002.1 DUF3892 domain-containing protein [Aeromonas veronii]MDF2415658.1 DUF3892 domain-containing protein [Aeromonas sp. 1HA1]PSJ88182.1 DUF3892 domain-containing protein [Aeromonas veronii]
MAKIIRGNADGKNGENQSYTIPGRGTISRSKAVTEVKQKKHPNHHVIVVNDVEYIRANRDSSKPNNIDEK